jgi:hypothetical protein
MRDQRGRLLDRGLLNEAYRFFVIGQQRLGLSSKLYIASASSVEEGGATFTNQLNRGLKNLEDL